MIKSRSGKEPLAKCEYCKGVLTGNKIYVHKQQNLCKKCIELVDLIPVTPTKVDTEYKSLLRKSMGL